MELEMASANNLSESMNNFRFLQQTNMLEVINRKPVDKEIMQDRRANSPVEFVVCLLLHSEDYLK